MSDFREIPGFEGRYSVTADGHVLSLPKTGIDGKAGGLRHSGRQLKPRTHANGYLRVSLMPIGEKKSKRFFVHRLVALAWIPNPDRHPRINHLNGQKQDNRKENLEWCSSAMNTQHAWDTGLIKVSENLRASARRNIQAANAKRRKEAA